MHKAIENGVSEGVFSNAVLPLLSGQLADDDRRAITMAIIEYLHQIMPV